MAKLIIGIDPDTNKSGLATYNPESKELSLTNKTFFDLLDTIYMDRVNTEMVKVEAGYLNDKSNFHYSRNALTAQKIAKNVGECNQTGRLIYQFCERHGIPAKEIPPLAKMWKGKNRKISYQEFQTLLETNGITLTGKKLVNQEVMDAGLIALAGMKMDYSEAFKVKI